VSKTKQNKLTKHKSREDYGSPSFTPVIEEIGLVPFRKLANTLVSHRGLFAFLEPSSLNILRLVFFVLSIIDRVVASETVRMKKSVFGSCGQ